MDAWLIVTVCIIVCLGSLLQSAAGFGNALFCIPLLLLYGIPLPIAIALVATCSFFQSAIGTSSLRKEIPWKLTFTAFFVSFSFCILGIFILRWLSTLAVENIQFTIGIILCFLVLFKIFIKIRTYEKLHWGWAAIAFSSSGFISGMCGMGGPPLVIWALFHDWSVKKTRGFLFSFFMIGGIFYLSILYITFGNDILWCMCYGIMLFPIVLAGSFLGLYVGNRMSKRTLQIVAYSILFVIGIKSIFPTLINFFSQ